MSIKDGQTLSGNISDRVLKGAYVTVSYVENYTIQTIFR